MLVEKESRRFFLHSKSASRFAGTVLDLMPCPIVIWDPDGLPLIFNHQVRQLTGFSSANFQEEPHLWMNRIDPRHRGLFSSAWNKLLGGEKMVSCDYRFLPNGDKKNIWLRDVSVSHRNSEGELQCITSAYSDISDLRARRQVSQEKAIEARTVEIIDGLIHEMQNNLQTIRIGFDLLRLDKGIPLESQAIADGIEQANRSLQEVREYFMPSKTKYSEQDPMIILENVVRQMENELHSQGVRIRMIHHNPPTRVRLDLRQLHAALERVMAFVRALLPQGGELVIETSAQEVNNQRYVEFRVATSSSTSLEVEEKDLVRPFLRVNHRQVGLSIALARQIIHRHQGKIFFQKQSPHKGVFTILLKALPD
ncbi:MAG: PAS domain-containing protein [Candidatus Binatia bacterium]